ncbi:Mating-type protein MAT-1 [Cladobotryum mycophilum]|uniref:Mating-type protein MAT-1 n=1 Tax=Cladobotryum mycophilum TaxID=491253 RepID=A0ABR0T3L7_9HYPO
MDSKAEIMKRLSALPAQDLLRLLRDETIFEIAARYFELTGLNQVQDRGQTQTSSVPSSTSSAAVPARAAPSDRAKRPLNAFMAFRSYYLKLFPDVQQKTASGFLTALWNKDPFRNKWALVAKVYSFVRDEIGRDKVSLSYFLGLSCPLMKITEPAVYLETFGWCVEDDETGTSKLFQTETGTTITETNLQLEGCPSTENELLLAVINVGYFPDESPNLVERMNTSSNGIMTTATSTLPVPYTREKLDFMKTIRNDPIQASKELFGAEYCEETVQALGVNSHNAHNLNSIGHLPMQIAYPDPRRYYNYATTHSNLAQAGTPVMRLDNLPDCEPFDIDSPWDLDTILGHTQQEAAGLPPSPQYNAHQDFHYAF